MDILDRDLKDVDMRKQDAYRLMATYNQETGEQFFDWVKVVPEGNVMLHESLRRLRAKQLPKAQRGNLKDLLPPLIVAVSKVGTAKTVLFASDRDKTEENVKKVEEMQSRILAEHTKFSVRFIERGRTSTFDDITTDAERQAVLWASIPDEELFETPKNYMEDILRREILEARMRQAPAGYTRARYRHFLGYD
ncbi:MAG: hypothetical protein J6Y53_05440 [Alphaproteobacteria bacterium]|nr:hypothetical protein [Alphaproteobacteria bacterium]